MILVAFGFLFIKFLQEFCVKLSTYVQCLSVLGPCEERNMDEKFKNRGRSQLLPCEQDLELRLGLPRGEDKPRAISTGKGLFSMACLFLFPSKHVCVHHFVSSSCLFRSEATAASWIPSTAEHGGERWSAFCIWKRIWFLDKVGMHDHIHNVLAWIHSMLHESAC